MGSRRIHRRPLRAKSGRRHLGVGCCLLCLLQLLLGILILLRRLLQLLVGLLQLLLQRLNLLLLHDRVRRIIVRGI